MRHSLFTNGKAKELKEIQECREKAGLPPLRMGYKICLRCSKQFFSEDKRNQHNCVYCRADDHI